jgi:Ca2+-binding EF-hand superfamily protein
MYFKVKKTISDVDLDKDGKISVEVVTNIAQHMHADSD